MEGIMTKRCTHCQRDLPLSVFPKHAGHRDGLGSHCKACKSQEDQVYRAHHRAALIAKEKAYYQANRARILALKSVEHLDPLTTYKTCPRCEAAKPLDAFSLQRASSDGRRSHCRDCIKAERAGWSADKKRQERERQRQWTKAHVEDERRRLRDYKRANKEKMRLAKQIYVAANHEKILAQQRQHRREKLEDIRVYQAAWARAHPEIGRAAVQRRRARQRGLPDTLTLDDIAALYQYWGFACAICGQQEGLFGIQLVLDHWIPIVAPACPGTVRTNIVLLCHGRGGCNNSKLSRDPILWLTRRYGERKAKAILKKIPAYFALVGGEERR
jgi:hypothetical protein